METARTLLVVGHISDVLPVNTTWHSATLAWVEIGFEITNPIGRCFDRHVAVILGARALSYILSMLG